MISLLVSSKTMQPNSAPFLVPTSQPYFLTEAAKLNSRLKELSPLQLRRLMHISSNLAQTTHKLTEKWQSKNGTPAWYTFVGDVYKGLKIEQFTKEDIEFAQKHMGTISGLYGFVRPLDTIHPYRLELMYRLTGKGHKNLYTFWGSKVADYLPANEPLINLSSEEYIKVVRPYRPENLIITPWFMQIKNGQPDFQVIHAKIARGTMARWIAKNRINNPADLKKFTENGYSYIDSLSTPEKPVFTRAEGYDFRLDY